MNESIGSAGCTGPDDVTGPHDSSTDDSSTDDSSTDGCSTDDDETLRALAAGRGGVYRLRRPIPATELATMLADDGWRVAVLSRIAWTPEFYGALRKALDLPDWTGSNLDALWDVLTDLREPTVLVWPAADAYAIAHPRRWPELRAVLAERAAQDPPFALVLA